MPAIARPLSPCFLANATIEIIIPAILGTLLFLMMYTNIFGNDTLKSSFSVDAPTDREVLRQLEKQTDILEQILEQTARIKDRIN